jgi:LuxR family maltose regulon positive regulatory protein
VQAKAAVLSTREREVLAHVAAGARNDEIASAMAISPFTVKRHVQNILQKLQLSRRADAAAFYRTAFEPEAQEAAPA